MLGIKYIKYIAATAIGAVRGISSSANKHPVKVGELVANVSAEYIKSVAPNFDVLRSEGVVSDGNICRRFNIELHNNGRVCIDSTDPEVRALITQELEHIMYVMGASNPHELN